MKTKNLFLITSVCALSVLISGCTMCHMPQPSQHEQHIKNKHHKKHKNAPVIFQQTYTDSDIHNVKASMYTRSANGGESEMGFIQFKETDNGLKMVVDLVDLRPGKTYTAQIYQCGTCNDSICCDTETMSIDLPQIKTNSNSRLQQYYIIRGLTATQLNNAKLILTRYGGYKAAWGTLN